MRGLLADVVDPVERRLERLVQQPDRLGRQRLPARDLGGVGRGLELRGERDAVVGCGARASRSRIAGNSSTSSAFGSMRPSVGSAAMDVMVFVEVPMGSRNKYEVDATPVTSSSTGASSPR